MIKISTKYYNESYPLFIFSGGRICAEIKFNNLLDFLRVGLSSKMVDNIHLIFCRNLDHTPYFLLGKSNCSFSNFQHLVI